VSKILRRQDGFGLIELLIAMTVLNVAILALYGTFNAGSLALRRAGMVSTAETLAEKQLELYRALPYDSIGMRSSLLSGTDATHQSDTAWNGGTQVVPTYCTSSSAPECNPQQSTVTGPDNRRYRIDSYVIAPTAPATGRAIIQATVAVRDVASGKLLARLVSTFDKSTGCGTTAYPCT
jgi:prepilin-type N-terminal cleavage/methylation domain-containing protein